MPERCSAAGQANPGHRAGPWQLRRLRAIHSTDLRWQVSSITAAFRWVENRAEMDPARSRRRAVRPSAILAEPRKKQGSLESQDEDIEPNRVGGEPRRPDPLALPKPPPSYAQAWRSKMFAPRGRPHQAAPPGPQLLVSSLPRASKTPGLHLEDPQALSSSSQNWGRHGRTFRRKGFPALGLRHLPPQGLS